MEALPHGDNTDRRDVLDALDGCARNILVYVDVLGVDEAVMLRGTAANLRELLSARGEPWDSDQLQQALAQAVARLRLQRRRPPG